MNKGFIVKVKMVKVKDKPEPIPAVSWMKPEFPYAVLDIWKWQSKDKETGEVKVFTKFLMGDQDTGIMHWVDAHGCDFVSVL